MALSPVGRRRGAAAGGSPPWRAWPALMPRHALMAAAGIAAVVALAGCGTDPAGSADAPGVLARLCRARAAEEPARTEAHFAAAHRSLHQLAGEVQQRDRSAATDLLQAKHAVEAALAEPADARSGLTGELSRLLSAVRDGLRAVDRPAPPCEPSEAPGG